MTITLIHTPTPHSHTPLVEDESDHFTNVGTVTVVASVGMTFTVSMVIGLILGIVLVYCIMKSRKTDAQGLPKNSDTQSAPPDPLYEEVSPVGEEMEMTLNEAYGRVNR